MALLDLIAGNFLLLVLVLFPLFAGLLLLLRYAAQHAKTPVLRLFWRMRHPWRNRWKHHFRDILPLLAWLSIALALALLYGIYPIALEAVTGPDIPCYSPHVIDGDTLDCRGQRIRLYGIDAPEMPGHCKRGRRCTPGDPYAAKDYLFSLTRASRVTCRSVEGDIYGRTVARCKADDKDLSCAMVKAGHAVKRYAPLLCPFWL
jgi:endonuclease YncB( thermonuclease family)